MPQHNLERNYYDKHRSNTNPTPTKEVEYGQKKLDKPQPNNKSISLSNNPEKK